jgi:hypothetical protein
MSFFTALFTNPIVKVTALTIFSLAILLALIIMYGKGDFSVHPFVYQGF